MNYRAIKKIDIKGLAFNYELEGFEVVKGGYKNLTDGEVLYGFGFNGIFQKGVVKGCYIVFEDEYGGVKSMKDEGLVSMVVKTVYSPLFRKV